MHFKKRMDLVTSLLGNKMFASLYDPNADKLAADFRAKAASSLSSLTNIVSKGADTKNILAKIPGVSDTTKASLDKLLAEAKTFTSSASTSLTPNAIAAKKDEVAAKIQDLIKQAKGEASTTADAKKEAKKQAVKDKIENKTVSATRLAKRIFTVIGYGVLILGLLVLALWGGSIASNTAIDLPKYMRFYYFIYGSLLFPVSIFLSIGKPIKYHALLAPLIEAPASSIFYPFVYTPVAVAPQEVTVVAAAVPVSEAAVLQTIAAATPAPAPSAPAPSAPITPVPIAPVPALTLPSVITSKLPDALTSSLPSVSSASKLIGLISKNAIGDAKR
jgi:hypothetical protein